MGLLAKRARAVVSKMMAVLVRAVWVMGTMALRRVSSLRQTLQGRQPSVTLVVARLCTLRRSVEKNYWGLESSSS